MNLKNVCIRCINDSRAVLEMVSSKTSKVVLPKSLPDANTATNCFRTLDGDVFSLTSEVGNRLPENVVAPLQKILSGDMTSIDFQHLMLKLGFSMTDIMAFFRSKVASVKGFTKAANTLELAQKGKFDINQDNLWVLYKDDIFQSFINGGSKNGQALKTFLQSNECYSRFVAARPKSLGGLISLNERSDILQDVFDKYKTAFGIDLTTPQKIYRFIGAEELKPLLAGETVHPRFYKNSNLLDVTLNPELNHDNYRVTFNYNSLDRRVSPNKPDYYYYHSRGDYSLSDVSAIDTVMPEGYLRIKTVKP